MGTVSVGIETMPSLASDGLSGIGRRSASELRKSSSDPSPLQTWTHGRSSSGSEPFWLVQHDGAIRRLVQARRSPDEILPKLLIERLREAAIDEDVHGKDVHAEHDDHGREVPERQPYPHAVGSPPLIHN